ncbi:ATP-binding protein [Poseidonocella sp. HB161398]|uniref:ATP-binding protein n=1 Tax=Poseidonocella sp. HB161398 TaxID=2320855 RepID=UPI001107C838|nr:ATP-binding protein [Poseidonocella sp. HB161398]
MTRYLEATPPKREYNQWVADETMEDFALRFTAKRARRWSAGRVANTAIGSISFLALETIGAALTLGFGFETAALAILVGGAILFLTGLPISYYAARYGTDIDLLTRGAGFGYIGSTITSLIYATFTFIFFALEATILALALEFCFGLPLPLGYILSALAIIPLVFRGFSKISRFQAWTQPFWIVLHLLPFLLLPFAGADAAAWTGFEGIHAGHAQGIVAFGAASAVVLSLIAQIGEQVDFLRFLPEPRSAAERRRWWLALLAAGPGWAVLGVAKMLAGSFLAVLALGAGVGASHLTDPAHLYFTAFDAVIPVPWLALGLTGAFVILSQLKINVTNAYAGSIAWSNFFSRVTHSHPGRVVWLFFNVGIAYLLMQFGVFAALESTLAAFSNVALAWIGALVADLVVNKPLGLSPKGIEFRRAYLYDLNPVGIGASGIAVIAGFAANGGVFGPVGAALSAFIALGTAFLAAPCIAWATRGRYYLARPAAPDAPAAEETACCVCGYQFEAPDMAHCPFYSGPICSLCCSLESSCNDSCKPHGRAGVMLRSLVETSLPPAAGKILTSRLGLFVLHFSALSGGVALLLWYLGTRRDAGNFTAILLTIFCIAMVLIGIGVWLFILIEEARAKANEEAERQTSRLLREIRAHERTDRALQEAKDKAEAANSAKTRYLAGLSHELRTPLNAIFGFAQIIEADPGIPPRRREAVSTIRRSSEHLAGLIEGLLDISKIEVGRIDLSRDRINLPAFLGQIAELFELRAREKNLDFVIRTSGKLPTWIIADEKRLRQIFINLLSNAIRYTDRGTVTLNFRYRNEIARIEVSDTGIGIEPSQLERIWLPFERGASSGRNGSGLGLTITRLLVEITGGEITVESRPGEGSSFRVRMMLPSVPDHAERQTTSEGLRAPRRAIGYAGRRRTLMIVDDDLNHLRLFESYFRPAGFNVVAAPDAETATRLLQDIGPDLFVLDIDLPGEDGWSFAHRLRREGYRATPVLMCSGHALEAGQHDPGDGVCDAFVTKPYNLAELLETIAALLKLVLEYEPPPPAPAPDTLLRQRIPAADLALLAESARIGHARGLEARLDAIEARGDGTGAQIGELRGMLQDYRMDEIEGKLQEWMEA